MVTVQNAETPLYADFREEVFTSAQKINLGKKPADPLFTACPFADFRADPGAPDRRTGPAGVMRAHPNR